MISASTLWELIELRAEATPDRVMVVDEHGRTLTFGDYRRQAEAAAAALHQQGIGPGTVVSWQLPNRLETVVLVAALSRLGAVQNPIAPLFREREVSFIVHQLASDVLMVPSASTGYDHAAMAERIATAAPGLAVHRVGGPLATGDPSVLPPPPATGEEVAPVRWVLYTSGTTSDPKGARHTDRGFAITAQNISRCMHMGEDDRNAIVFPFAHIGGILYVFADLMVGSSSVMVERFGPDAVDVLSREGITIAGAGVPFFREYLKAQRRTPDHPIFPRIKAFVGGGSTRPPEIHGELLEAFGVGVLSGYGLTEAGSFAMTDLDDSFEQRALTEGRPYPGTEVRVVGPGGEVLGVGEEGEVRLQGPQMMLGYVDASLDVAFDDDGFFCTGDLGFLDPDGFLTISGRIKDIIIRKGENISAREVEDLLYLHHQIDDVAVVGLPDPDTGERACAVAVLVDRDEPVDLHDLREFLVGKGLAVQKVPEQLEIVDHLPKNVGGKVLKPALREQLREKPYQRATSGSPRAGAG